MTMPPVLSSANSPCLYCYDGVSDHTHSEVHKTQELLQHFRHDGEIAFRKMLSHSSHIYLRGGGTEKQVNIWEWGKRMESHFLHMY